MVQGFCGQQNLKPSRVSQALVSLKCVEQGTLQVSPTSLVVGLIKRVHTRDECLGSI